MSIIHNEPFSIKSEFKLIRWLVGPPRQLQEGAGCQNKKVIRRLELLAPPQELRVRHDWSDLAAAGTQSPMANDLIIHAYLMNLDNDEVWESFLVGEQVEVLGEWHTLTPWRQRFLSWRHFGTLPYEPPLQVTTHLYPL